MAAVSFRNVSKHYGAVKAVRNLSLDIKDREFFVLLGPAGAGKSTTLRCIAGLEQPQSGDILIADDRINDWSAAQRDVALVFQQYSLYPNYTVRENLAFPLKSKLRSLPAAEIEQRVAKAAATVRITHLLDRRTDRLSGGEMQRVSIGRAIVREPRVFLMDEPLSALDAKLRESLREELLDLHRRVGATSLYVTHDQDEAMAMSDRIVVINDGRVIETGVPAVLYHRPKTLFTARFLGNTSIVEAKADGSDVLLPWGQVARADHERKGPVHLSIRPEDFSLQIAPDGPGTVMGGQFLGASIRYRVEIAGQVVMASVAGRETMLAPGARVSLTPVAPLHLLETAGA